MIPKVAVVGATGRMGLEVLSIIESLEALELGTQVSQEREGDISCQLGTQDVSVVIDFSLPKAFSAVLAWCVEAKTPLVSGTTGLSNEQFDEIKSASSKIPILWAPNMSLGVAMMRRLIQQLKPIAQDFDFQIEDFHHRYKKDAPSGTGVQLQKTLSETVQKPVPEVLSVRGGGIFGIHKLWAMSSDETLCIEHTALNRRVFADGAVKAALWLMKQPPGEYTIDHVLES